MSTDLYDEPCDKCGKSLFMVHPWPELNCSCPDESYKPLYHDDESTRYASFQLKDIPLDGKFILNGVVYTKRSQLGWALGFLNVVDCKGQKSHVHPTTVVGLIQ